jgi:putative chitinase
MITQEQLKQIFPDASADTIELFVMLFNEYRVAFDIRTEFQVSAFIAQIKVEVGSDLVSKRENLNYSCDALISTFSYYKEHEDEAYQDGRCNDHEADQVSIGNKAYGNRLGNGSPETGDGYLFRGGGYFQLTGRGHYTDLANGISEKINIQISPEKLAEHITETYYGLLSAMSYWDKYCYHCNDGEIDCITSSINHHTDTYDERKETYYEVHDILY